MIFSSLDLTTMYLIRASVSIVPLLPRKGRLGCKRLVTSKKNKQTKQNTKIRLWFLMYKMWGGGGEVTYEVICHLLNHRCDVNLRKIEIDLIDKFMQCTCFLYILYILFFHVSGERFSSMHFTTRFSMSVHRNVSLSSEQRVLFHLRHRRNKANWKGKHHLYLLKIKSEQ